MSAITYKTHQKLIDKSDGTCYICKLPLDLESFQRFVSWKRKWKHRIKSDEPRPRRIKVDVNVDHVKPLSKGGTNDITNLALVHVKCNTNKGSEVYEQ